MMDLDVREKVLRKELPHNGMGPVFLSATDGKLKSVNQMAAKILDEINVIDEFLPVDHKSLVMACLQTKLSLKRECKLGGLNITWSYQASDKTNYVYIHGNGFSVRETPAACKLEDFPRNTCPVISFSKDGELQSFNSSTSKFLNRLSIVEVENVLPFNHQELLHACIEGKVAVTQGRGIDGNTYVWTYDYSIDNDEVNIYGRDLSIYDFKSTPALPASCEYCDLEFSTDKSGVTKFINYATYKLLDELGVTSINDVLPQRHMGLVKACLMTSTLLTEKCKVLNRLIVWSYNPNEDGESVQVYGCERK